MATRTLAPVSVVDFVTVAAAGSPSVASSEYVASAATTASIETRSTSGSFASASNCCTRTVVVNARISSWFATMRPPRVFTRCFTASRSPDDWTMTRTSSSGRPAPRRSFSARSSLSADDPSRVELANGFAETASVRSVAHSGTMAPPQRDGLPQRSVEHSIVIIQSLVSFRSRQSSSQTAHTR